MLLGNEDLVPVFVRSVVDARCVEKPLGTKNLLLGAVSWLVAGVRGTLLSLGACWILCSLCVSLHVFLCKLLNTGLSGVPRTQYRLCLKTEAYLKGKVKNFLLE